ncbi:hypothetical protein [Veillonella sp. VA142]|uniref:hypothetical protein n=1 Tax=Veillonella sp. VA142 TaxID=741834 RepID=UPI000F8D9E3F|nr:hypothetical protein [Veillonella sp. VA142]
MTTWFNDLKELIWHPKSRGFDQIAEHGTVKKGLLTYFCLDIIFSLIVASLLSPLIGFLADAYVLEIAALGSAIILGMAVFIFVVRGVGLFINSAIFFGLYKLTKGSGTWSDVVKGFIYGNIITNVYGSIAGLILLVSIAASADLLLVGGDISALGILGIIIAIGLWIFYQNISLMSRILLDTKGKVFILYIITGIVLSVLEYMVK